MHFFVCRQHAINFLLLSSSSSNNENSAKKTVQKLGRNVDVFAPFGLIRTTASANSVFGKTVRVVNVARIFLLVT